MVLGNPCKRVIRPPKGCDPQVENCCFKAIMRVKEMVKKEKIKSWVFNFIAASTKWEYLEDCGGPTPPKVSEVQNNLNIFHQKALSLVPQSVSESAVEKECRRVAMAKTEHRGRL